MRMRTALAVSVLAAGVLLGGAGSAFADDGFGVVNATGSQGAEMAEGTSFAGVIDNVGPVWATSSKTASEWDRFTFRGIFGH